MKAKLLRLAGAGIATTLAFAATAGNLRVSTDFEGGSARIESVDSEARVVRFMPGGDPQRGWPCWWYLRVDGVARNEQLTLDLAGSDLPSRNKGTNTGKPLAASWAMPARATFSTDARTWRHTAPGRRDGARILYEVAGTGGPLWVAWGPPFTPRDSDALLATAEKSVPATKSFELARTREGRPVRGLRVSEATASKPRGVWVQARQHAWESGSSWVARGFVEWLVSDDADARWLRRHAEVFVVPLMDVDNVATGNGGKEAAPRDHNRDWDDKPVHPEVAAAQRRLLELARENRLEVFLDLHNPGPGDAQPFFSVGPPELLTETGRAIRSNFLARAQQRINGPLALAEKPRLTGPAYHPLWRQISGQWVNAHGNPHTLAACLETSWNTVHSTTEGYRTVGRQLGLAVTDHLRAGAVSVH
jgi:hypothetical protein